MLLKIKSQQPSYFGLHFVATSTDTAGKYFLCKATVPVGDPGPPPHRHGKEDEGFFLQEGNLVFQVGNDEITVDEGSFINIPKGTTHTWRNEGNKEARLLITFAPAGIENMFVELDELMRKGEGRFQEKLVEIGRSYGTEFFVKSR